MKLLNRLFHPTALGVSCNRKNLVANQRSFTTSRGGYDRPTTRQLQPVSYSFKKGAESKYMRFGFIGRGAQSL